MANLESYEGWPEDKWRQGMEEHPFFRTQPISEEQDVPPLIEALQQLKYDPNENTAEELATAYKEDGNENFKFKKYRWAVDCYSKGLEYKCGDKHLNAALYCNRGAAHYHVGNYKKALKDASEALKLRPDYLKAFHRGAMCCLKLNEYADCITWCDDGLKFSPDDNSLLDMKETALEKKKLADRNRRKAAVQEIKRKKKLDELKMAIKDRGICLAEEKLEEYDLVPRHCALPPVHFNGGCLEWPVVFMYPEYQIQDSIQNFHENSSFLDHLHAVFNPETVPEWDKRGDYIPENLQLYFCSGDSVIPFDKASTLKAVLSDNRYKVFNGTPEFIITVHNSKFDVAYRSQHCVK